MSNSSLSLTDNTTHRISWGTDRTESSKLWGTKRLNVQILGVPIVSSNILCVMRPHTEDFDNPLLLQDLINQSVLDIDPVRIRAAQIAYQFLQGRRCLHVENRKRDV